MKFKVGDRVRIRPDTRFYMEGDKSNPIHEVGTIDFVGEPELNELNISVKWDGGITNSYDETDLIFVNSHSRVGDMKLNNFHFV